MWHPYSIYWHKVSIQIPKIKTRGTIRNNWIKAEPNSNTKKHRIQQLHVRYLGLIAKSGTTSVPTSTAHLTSLLDFG